MLAMLVHGGTDLPAKVPTLSPWVDADLGVPADQVAAALAAQNGRRVVKTHSPADGFPVWQGVTVIAAYRHPLDVFFSLRNHTANRTNPGQDDPTAWPLAQSVDAYLDGAFVHDQVAQENLASLTTQYTQTMLSGRLPDLKLFHYADMVRDGRRTVQALARAADIDADAGLVNKVTETTAFGAMKAKAADDTPVAGTGFWKSDANSFHSASSRKGQGKLSVPAFARYHHRLADLIADVQARGWL